MMMMMMMIVSYRIYMLTTAWMEPPIIKVMHTDVSKYQSYRYLSCMFLLLTSDILVTIKLKLN